MIDSWIFSHLNKKKSSYTSELNRHLVENIGIQKMMVSMYVAVVISHYLTLLPNLIHDAVGLVLMSILHEQSTGRQMLMVAGPRSHAVAAAVILVMFLYESMLRKKIQDIASIHWVSNWCQDLMYRHIRLQHLAVDVFGVSSERSEPCQEWSMCMHDIADDRATILHTSAWAHDRADI